MRSTCLLSKLQKNKGEVMEEKNKSTKELAKEIVNIWNQQLDNETEEEFKERTKKTPDTKE